MATGGQALNTLDNRLPGQGVQHQIDARTPGDLLDMLGKVQGARIHDLGNAHCLENSPLARITGRGIDLCAGLLGNLHGRQSQSARGGMDQHPLAGPQPG